ncbi:MAG: metal ABC transporter ATP-binding protein [Rhodospirillaceae bacterium]|jgi:zinc transport system ATP-binding protein|nr:metal ABC transporter ATP-binding protein [Rhodospirillaceae bacterium]
MNTLIAAHDLTVSIDGRTLIDQVSFSVPAGEIVTIIGPNGGGKTTLLKALLGLIKTDRGRVERAPKLTLGYMPQKLAIDRALPLTARRFIRLSGRIESGTAQRVGEECDITHLLDRDMSVLSGGEIQRVLLARSLAHDPDLLVLDEPAQGMDVTGQAALFELLARIRDRRGCSVLMVSHDLHLVMRGTDRVICLNGHICCTGGPEEVRVDPAFAELFGARAADQLALYHHHHDHTHDDDGSVVPLEGHGHHGHEHHGHDHGHGGAP